MIRAAIETPRLIDAVEPAGKRPVEAAVYDVADLVILLKTSLRTVRELISSGRIPGRVTLTRRALFNKQTVDAWIASGCRAAKGAPTR
jgi:excisionase family DNA binding protein